MAFKPSSLQLEILDIVAGLLFGRDRTDLHDGSPVSLDLLGVPTEVIEAELHDLGDSQLHHKGIRGAIAELTTRELLEGRSLRYPDEWPHVAYRRPDGRSVSTGIDRDTGLPWVLVGDTWFRDDLNEVSGNLVRFSGYWITRIGLEVLDPRQAGEAGESYPAHELRLNLTEQLILEALGNGPLIGEQIADKTKIKYAGSLRNTLSGLVKRGMLISITGRGYEITPKGTAAITASQNQVEDSGQD